MRESYWWLLAVIVTIFLAVVAILYREIITSDSMIVEILATLFGVLIALALSEAFRANREESRAKWVEEELVDELKEILELAQREGFDELHSPTWTAVRGTGIPDRIEPKVRRALADAFAVLDIYNYEIRRLKEHSFTANSEDIRLKMLEMHISETKNRLIAAAIIVLKMVEA
ncbi:MAG: hypothetical protein ACXAEF_10340 [Candidatus Thorarchaeota archaeon]|jgi:hypothetical protein